jgi:hypothetical protein
MVFTSIFSLAVTSPTAGASPNSVDASPIRVRHKRKAVYANCSRHRARTAGANPNSANA